MENAVWTNQFDNIANRQAHIETTGPEIWAQTFGKVDGFTCSTGTGGSFAGVTRFLKEASDGRVKAFLADPPGSVLCSYIKSNGVLLDRSGSSITEGIGQGRVTDNLAQDIDLVDDAMTISDEKTIKMIYRLLDEEGLYLGASSCLNVVAAYEMAQTLGKGSTVVTLLCDGGMLLFFSFTFDISCKTTLTKFENLAYRYAERLFSQSWLESKKLRQEIPAHLEKYIVLP